MADPAPESLIPQFEFEKLLNQGTYPHLHPTIPPLTHLNPPRPSRPPHSPPRQNHIPTRPPNRRARRLPFLAPTPHPLLQHPIPNPQPRFKRHIPLVPSQQHHHQPTSNPKAQSHIPLRAPTCQKIHFPSRSLRDGDTGDIRRACSSLY